jgi:hypothetical protein
MIITNIQYACSKFPAAAQAIRSLRSPLSGNAADGLIGWKVRSQRDGGGQVCRQGVSRNRHGARGLTSGNAVVHG